jgi:hypothetical protein
MPLLLDVCLISDSTGAIFVLAFLRLPAAAVWNEALCGFPVELEIK